MRTQRYLAHDCKNLNTIYCRKHFYYIKQTYNIPPRYVWGTCSQSMYYIAVTHSCRTLRQQRDLNRTTAEMLNYKILCCLGTICFFALTMLVFYTLKHKLYLYYSIVFVCYITYILLWIMMLMAVYSKYMKMCYQKIINEIKEILGKFSIIL